MKKLSKEEIKQFGDALGFTMSEATDITDLFYRIKQENPANHWRVELPLSDVDEYIREWENHWHRENSFTECFEYERDNEYSEYEAGVAEKIFEDMEAFKEYTMGDKETQFIYQLPNSEMVVVVC